MVGDQLAKLESQVDSSLSGNFSTSESTNTNHNKKQEPSLQICAQYRLSANSVEAQLHDYEVKPEKIDEQMQNRLFTFMDQKDCQKKMIQNFFFNRANSHHYQLEQNQENNMQLLNMANAGIQRLVQDSKKKQHLSPKIILNTKRQTKSNKKISLVNKNRTPKNTPQRVQKYLTIDSKNQNSALDQESYRSITPKYEKETRLIRARSSLENTLLDYRQIAQNKQVKHIELKMEKKLKTGRNEESKKKCANISAKELLRKKKQLEKQLQEINSSLICRKKKGRPTNVPFSNKLNHLKPIPDKKRSTQKLPLSGLKSTKHVLN